MIVTFSAREYLFTHCRANRAKRRILWGVTVASDALLFRAVRLLNLSQREEEDEISIGFWLTEDMAEMASDLIVDVAAELQEDGEFSVPSIEQLQIANYLAEQAFSNPTGWRSERRPS